MSIHAGSSSVSFEQQAHRTIPEMLPLDQIATRSRNGADAQDEFNKSVVFARTLGQDIIQTECATLLIKVQSFSKEKSI